MLTTHSKVVPSHKSRRAQAVVPSDNDILLIPRAQAGEYELSDKEVRVLRQRIYRINKDNAAGWKFRTMRDRPYLMVWRIR